MLNELRRLLHYTSYELINFRIVDSIFYRVSCANFIGK